MEYSGESRWEVWRALSPRQARYYREVLAIHADRPETGACPVCRLSRCPDWTSARDILLSAGEPLAEDGHG